MVQNKYYDILNATNAMNTSINTLEGARDAAIAPLQPWHLAGNQALEQYMHELTPGAQSQLEATPYFNWQADQLQKGINQQAAYGGKALSDMNLMNYYSPAMMQLGSQEMQRYMDNLKTPMNYGFSASGQISGIEQQHGRDVTQQIGTGYEQQRQENVGDFQRIQDKFSAWQRGEGPPLTEAEMAMLQGGSPYYGAAMEGGAPLPPAPGQPGAGSYYDPAMQQPASPGGGTAPQPWQPQTFAQQQESQQAIQAGFINPDGSANLEAYRQGVTGSRELNEAQSALENFKRGMGAEPTEAQRELLGLQPGEPILTYQQEQINREKFQQLLDGKFEGAPDDLIVDILMNYGFSEEAAREFKAPDMKRELREGLIEAIAANPDMNIAEQQQRLNEIWQAFFPGEENPFSNEIIASSPAFFSNLVKDTQQDWSKRFGRNHAERNVSMPDNLKYLKANGIDIVFEDRKSHTNIWGERPWRHRIDDSPANQNKFAELYANDKEFREYVDQNFM